MRNIFFLLLILVSITAVSQQKAVTETGEEVLLFDDGTWKPVNGASTAPKEVKTNPKVFSKGSLSTFLLKSTKFNVGFWLDPKKWNFEKAKNNPDAEFELQLKNGDLYGMIITEKMEIPLETLKNIAIENGKKVAPDLAVINEEYRNVNGLKVLHLQMQGTMQGIKFYYYGYYYSNANGTVQFMNYSAQNLLNNYIPEMDNLLNGLVEIK